MKATGVRATQEKWASALKVGGVITDDLASEDDLVFSSQNPPCVGHTVRRPSGILTHATGVGIDLAHLWRSEKRNVPLTAFSPLTIFVSVHSALGVV